MLHWTDPTSQTSWTNYQDKRATAIWLSRACACFERPVKTIET